MNAGWDAAPRRLVILQYGGDYREAYERLAAGGEETYHAQRYSVDEVGRFAESWAVATVCFRTEERYDEVLRNGVRAVGAGMAEPLDRNALVSILEGLQPTRVVLRTPIPELLAWTIERRTPTIAVLSESLAGGGEAERQTRLLNDPVIEWVGCKMRSLADRYVEVGVDPHKVIAWGWPTTWAPEDLPPKLRFERAPTRLVYVGALIEDKGIGDLLEAVAVLRRAGREVNLSLFGAGEDARRLRRRANRLRIGRFVHWGGAVPNSAVLNLMRTADVVIVPSRTASPEALPQVIDQSLCARTPAVVSAHPAYADRFEHRHSAMLFPPGDVDALASCVEELVDDPALYRHISASSAEAWHALQAPITWGEVLEAWLADTPERSGWLREQTIAAARGARS